VAERAEVVFVDGVRTPFGRAGEKGQYWNTRADDLIVKAMIGLLERNPNLPKERVDDVGIAATTQTGDQGLTLGRTASILAGMPLSVPGYALDRMCAGPGDVESLRISRTARADPATTSTTAAAASSGGEKRGRATRAVARRGVTSKGGGTSLSATLPVAAWARAR
jgi:hypothetical protein